MTISSLSSENLLITQKLLQDVSDNKKLNLSAEQKIAFKEVLTEALLGNGINTISDIQKQSIINELKKSNGLNNYLYGLNPTTLDGNVSTIQQQIFNSLGLSNPNILSTSNPLLTALSNPSVASESAPSKIGNNAAAKTKAMASYQQQSPISLSTNMGALASRIGDIRSGFFI
ncbi:hypothetical protein [Lysinibacillus pakistanensis]|uniref:Uncharacterized protein n=1 Tax=Lysinibacillus pakistanensis TaxID=759811 RepID=A0ABX6DAA5_9BACI|nr:hypothetical protein GDS87_10815 [Lysinibacillus pakistanensis]